MHAFEIKYEKNAQKLCKGSAGLYFEIDFFCCEFYKSTKVPQITDEV